jgi:hypothetical protein
MTRDVDEIWLHRSYMEQKTKRVTVLKVVTL